MRAPFLLPIFALPILLYFPNYTFKSGIVGRFLKNLSRLIGLDLFKPKLEFTRAAYLLALVSKHFFALLPWHRLYFLINPCLFIGSNARDHLFGCCRQGTVPHELWAPAFVHLVVLILCTAVCALYHASGRTLVPCLVDFGVRHTSQEKPDRKWQLTSSLPQEKPDRKET